MNLFKRLFEREWYSIFTNEEYYIERSKKTGEFRISIRDSFKGDTFELYTKSISKLKELKYFIDKKHES